MAWLKNWLQSSKDPEKRLKADYLKLINLGIILDEEWQLEENRLLLLVEESGLGG
ncbi:hypothetical protein [Zhaonella formicivorans]|uniref:hypothetical protein n=1 Tax=Zhaonella formicivorans TaxID=2528593 RepID=UPI001D0FDC1A|nr:hypothetical protein [Zhaonella formicivorans]